MRQMCKMCNLACCFSKFKVTMCLQNLIRTGSIPSFAWIPNITLILTFTVDFFLFLPTVDNSFLLPKKLKREISFYQIIVFEIMSVINSYNVYNKLLR